MSDFYAVERLLAYGAAVVTPGRRLADALQMEWARRCMADGQNVWRAPPVYSLDEFLLQLWEQLLQSGDAQTAALLRIGRHAECALWEKIIASDPECALLQVGATAAHARQAQALLQRWRIDPAQEKHAAEFRLSSEGRRFLHWRDEFMRLCERRGWCSDGAAEERLLRAFEEGRLAPAPKLLLYGFEALENLPPLRRALLETAARELLQEQASRCEPQRVLLERRDAEQEAYAAALWARRIVGEQPEARVAVASPQLDQRRLVFERAFREVFTPAGILPDSAPSEGLFNIAAPQALARAPVVAAALQLLELICSGLSPQNLRALLHSPFFVAERESAAALGMLADRLLEWRGERVSQQQLQKLSARCECKVLDAALRGLAAPPSDAESMHWAAHFQSWLRGLGWPGSRTPDSAEYQQLQRLERAWEQFAAGAEVYGALRPGAALQRLRKLLQDISFQPRGGRVQVDILTLQEARGLRFDHLWLCGMEQSVWPPPAEINPLLPGPLQRSCGMPGADLQREQERSAQIADELRAAARHSLAVSYPAMEEERELGVPGFFFADLERASAEDLLADSRNPQRQWMEEFRAQARLQEQPEDRAAPCTEQPASGTAGLLRDQSACSFRAFARHRLGVSGRPQHAQPTLSAAERGNIVHRMMQYFWDGMQSSAALRECPPEKLERAVAEAAVEAVEETVLAWERCGAPSRPRFWELERRRLGVGLKKWLPRELEHAREEGDFEICATEEAREFSLGELMEMRLRIDRLEKRPDGSLVLLDYKTGRAAGRSANTALRQWSGPFPEDPQLPLYALACAEEGPLYALGWGFVDVRELQRVTPSDQDLSVSWSDLCEEWREDLLALAQEYLDGVARVHPRQADACEYCAMQALCRIRQAQ